MPNRIRRKSVVELLKKMPVAGTRGSLLTAIEKLLKTIDISESAVMIPTLLRDKCQFDALELLIVAKILKASILGHSDLVEFYMNHIDLPTPTPTPTATTTTTIAPATTTATPSSTITTTNGFLSAQSTLHTNTTTPPSSSSLATNESLLCSPTTIVNSQSVSTSSVASIEGRNAWFAPASTQLTPLCNSALQQQQATQVSVAQQATSQPALPAINQTLSADSLLTTATDDSALEILASQLSKSLANDDVELQASACRPTSLSLDLNAPQTTKQLLADGSLNSSSSPLVVENGNCELAAHLHNNVGDDPGASVRLLLQIEQLKSSIHHVTTLLEDVVELYKKSVDSIAAS